MASKGVCTFPDCGRRLNARGLCTTHYMQWQKGKPLTPVGSTYPRRQPCSYQDCDRLQNAHGYCRPHEQQHKKGVELRPIRAKRKNGTGCVTFEGYLLITVSGEQILEHRYVIQQHLGRALMAHENVHHVNGDRLDNRLENLELWSTSQPPGQRVEDKVAWAKELLALYEPEALARECPAVMPLST